MSEKVKLRQLSVSEKEEVYKKHLGLVVSIAARYHSSSFTLEDLIQEGVLGLFEAAERFNPNKGYRFSTYAIHWIRKTIREALINKGQMIRIPVKQIEQISRYTRTRRRLLQEHGREPLIEEVAAAMNITEKKVQKIRKTLQALPKTVSLSTQIGKDSLLLEFIQNKETAPSVELAKREIRKEIKKTLNPREQRIICLKYGLEDGVFRTLKEVSKKIGLGRERIRQIQKKAIGKMKKKQAL